MKKGPVLTGPFCLFEAALDAASSVRPEPPLHDQDGAGHDQGAGVGQLGDVMPGGPVKGGDEASMRAIGKLICAEGDDGLAVMPIDAGDGPFSADGQPCTRLPLLDGLAR